MATKKPAPKAKAKGNPKASKPGVPATPATPKYSKSLVTEIAARLSTGEPLAVICRDKHMPTDWTVREWMKGDEEIANAIARARESGFDMIAADVLRIADTPVVGVIEKFERVEHEDGTFHMVVVERRNEDMLGHRKLQVDTRLKLLAKWDPKRYGDFMRTEISGVDGGAIKVTTDIDQIDAEIKQLLDRNPALKVLMK